MQFLTLLFYHLTITNNVVLFFMIVPKLRVKFMGGKSEVLPAVLPVYDS